MNLILFIHYFVNLIIFESVISKKYTQEEIDDAYEKMTDKKSTYSKLHNKRGCWPDNIIPYFIDDGFKPEQVENILKHIYQIQNRTCLRWVQLEKAQDVDKYIEFVRSENENNCRFSEYGVIQTGITSKIELGKNCFPPMNEAVIHEMVHALGFAHEHQRIDRDCYVQVDDDQARTNYQFKINYDDLSFEKWPYDKRSIVHYFSAREVLRDKDDSFWGFLWRYRLGDSHGWWGDEGKHLGKLSYMDVYKLNYRFCGAPDYCQTRPEVCVKIEEDEKRYECKDLYMDIALGIVLPSKKIK